MTQIFTTYLAWQNDLYEVTFTYDAHIIQVICYPNSSAANATELDAWRLPEELKERIRNRIMEQL